MIRCFLAALMLVCLASTAEARPRTAASPICDNVDVMRPCESHAVTALHAVVAGSSRGIGARPHAWCGWWMRQHLGVANSSGNLARWWAGYGRSSGGPAIGALVVWAHHVGIITGGSSGAWIVKSGNDGNAVRERVRPLGGAIAFRWP
jgi:hypothetical protein